jgi:hypothetical protein
MVGFKPVGHERQEQQFPFRFFCGRLADIPDQEVIGIER